MHTFGRSAAFPCLTGRAADLPNMCALPTLPPLWVARPDTQGYSVRRISMTLSRAMGRVAIQMPMAAINTMKRTEAA